MKIVLCLLCSAVLVVVAVLTFTDNDNQLPANQEYDNTLLNEEEVGEKVSEEKEGEDVMMNNDDKKTEFYTSVEGVWESGVKYEFHGKDKVSFDFEEFKEHNYLTVEEKLDFVEFAKTPIEAAEIGLRYLRPHPIEEDTIIIRYCPKSDLWVMYVIYDMPIMGGFNVLTVNMSDGSMAYYYDGLA
jgi:uncharacterized protein YxeA